MNEITSTFIPTYNAISLYSVIGDFFMILRPFKDVVFQIMNKKKQKIISNMT